MSDKHPAYRLHFGFGSAGTADESVIPVWPVCYFEAINCGSLELAFLIHYPLLYNVGSD